jgi:hypothetical protein
VKTDNGARFNLLDTRRAFSYIQAAPKLFLINKDVS